MDTVHGTKNDYSNHVPCANIDQLDRNTFETLNSVDANGVENRNDILRVGDRSEDQVRQFGLAELQKIGYEGDRNYSATSMGIKEILVQDAQGTASGIQTTNMGIASVNQGLVGGFKDVALGQCSSTGSINANLTAGFAAGSLAGANQTASIIYGQKDLSIEATANAAAVALQNATIGAASQQSMANGFCDVKSQAAMISSMNMQSIDKSFCGVELQAAQNKGFLELQAAQYKSALELQASQYKGSSDLLAMSNAKDAETSRQIIAKDAAILANLNYYNLNTLAVTNQAAVLAKITECCCETQKAIDKTQTLIEIDGNKTRQLMQNDVIQDLRDKLLKAEMIITTKAAATPLTTGTAI